MSSMTKPKNPAPAPDDVPVPDDEAALEASSPDGENPYTDEVRQDVPA